uniref:Aminotransferase-like plant mobile domain-containing protein n=1 Tax=Fagus sylvatica TaxID=28930 RepID=A0A2N9HPB9_FAGSY
MASSSNDPDSLVTLHFHDFRVERMRHWWTLLGEDDHADIVGFFGKFPPFMRLPVDRGLLEALASLLGPDPLLLFHWGRWILSLLWRNSPDLRKLGGKPTFPLDLLTKYFSRSAFPAKLARDFIAGKKGWKKFRINAFKIAFAGIFLFPTSAGRIDLGVIPIETGRGGSDVLHTASFSSGSAVTCGISTASRLLITLRGIRSLGGQQCGMPWTHCALFDGVPLPGVWGCTGYYPSLALRQFGGVQYPPRLGDLDAFLIEEGSPGDSSVASDFVEWREGWTPFFTLRPTVRPGAHHILWMSRSLRVSASTGQPERVTVLERELEEAQTELLSLRLARASEREASAARVESLRSTLHHNKSSSRFLRMLRNSWRRTLAEAREQLETEQAERTRVQDELDSLRSYTQALVDPATGRPQDIVALRRALDASEEALTSARTSMGVMRVQISVLQGDNGVLQSELDLVHDALESNASWLNQEGFPVVTSLPPD